MKKCITSLIVWETLTETTMKFYYKPAILAKMCKSENSKFWWQYEARETLAHYWKEYKLVRPLKLFAIHLIRADDASTAIQLFSTEEAGSAENLALTPWCRHSQSVVPPTSSFSIIWDLVRNANPRPLPQTSEPGHLCFNKPSGWFCFKLKFANHLTQASNVCHELISFLRIKMVRIIHHFCENWENSHSNHFLFCGSD